MTDKPKLQLFTGAREASEELAGNTKVTRQDWLNVAMDVLVSDGVEHVKVLTLGERLDVSRSSFYWYFKSRQDLLDALLEHWEETNTQGLVTKAELPAKTITEAALNVTRCFVDEDVFNTRLDFAVREWARRSGPVRKVLDRSDESRLASIRKMFARFDYPPQEAEVRARVLYYMQIGYNFAELNETMEFRLSLVADYIHVFTGRHASQRELDEFVAYARSVQENKKA